MITKFKFLFLLVALLTCPTFATETPPAPAGVDPQKYIWLYELLLPSEDRINQPDKAFKSFRVHLKDTDEVFQHPHYLSAAHFNAKNSIQGKITYVGFIPKKYHYDVIYTPNSTDIILHVKVHFKNPQNQDLENLRRKFSEAELIWNSNQVALDFKYRFQFQVAATANEAHFSVTLLDQTRGPYDTNWSRSWSSISIAHELGHMLGLGDEYQTITSESDCLAQSLMCESNSAAPMWHHYYFILRRLMSPEKNFGEFFF